MKWLNKLTKPAAKKAPTKAKTPLVSSYLSEKRIVFFPAGPSKRQVLGSLIATLDLKDPSAAIKLILAREEMGSTIIAPGLALPHARMDGLTKIEAAIGICPTGERSTRSGASHSCLCALPGSGRQHEGASLLSLQHFRVVPKGRLYR